MDSLIGKSNKKKKYLVPNLTRMNRTIFKCLFCLLLIPLLALMCHLYLKDLIINNIIFPEIDKGNNGIALETRSLDPDGFKSLNWKSAKLDITVTNENSLTEGYTALYIPTTQNYIFKVDADDASEIQIDGKSIIAQDRSKPNASNVSKAIIFLESGYHLLCIKLFNGPQKGRLKLYQSIDNGKTFSAIDEKHIFIIDLGNIGNWATLLSLISSFPFGVFAVSLFIIIALGFTLFICLVAHDAEDKKIFLNGRIPVNYLIIFLLICNFILLFVRYLSADMGIDAARCGVVALSVLRSFYPIFYFGKKLLGTLDAYMLAPIIWLFGPSVLTLNIIPLLSVFSSLIILFYGLKKYFNLPVALFFLAYNAFPTYAVLYWSAEARNQYPLLLLFSSIITTMSFAIYWRSQDKPHWLSQGLLFFLFGLVCGLAVWTNYLSLITIVFCVLVLMIRSFKKGNLISFTVLTSIGMLVALTPYLWVTFNQGKPLILLFNTHPNEHGFALLLRLENIVTYVIPAVLGLNPYNYFVPFIMPILLAAFICPLLFCVGFFIQNKNPFYIFPLAMVILNLFAVMFGGRASFQLKEIDQRYLLQVTFIAIPLAFAFTSQYLFKFKKSIYFIAIGGVVFTHILFYNTKLQEHGGYFGGGQLLSVSDGFYFNTEPYYRGKIRSIKNAGVKNIYMRGSPEILNFLSGNDIFLSEITSMKTWLCQMKNDSSLKAAFFDKWEENFKSLGLPYATKAGLIIEGPYSNHYRALSCAFLNCKISDNNNNPLLSVSDNCLITSYFVEKPKMGDGITIDFLEKRKIAGLSIINDSLRAYPNDITIQYQNKVGVFCDIRSSFTDSNINFPLYVSGPKAVCTVLFSRKDIYFDTVETSKIKINFNREKGEKGIEFGEMCLYLKHNDNSVIDWIAQKEIVLNTAKKYKDYEIFADTWAASVIKDKYLKKIDCTIASPYTDPYGSLQLLVDNIYPISRAKISIFLVENKFIETILAQLERYQFDFTTENIGHFNIIKISPQRGKVLFDNTFTIASDSNYEIVVPGNHFTGAESRVNLIEVKPPVDSNGAINIDKIFCVDSQGNKTLLTFQEIPSAGFSGAGVFALKNGPKIYRLNWKGNRKSTVEHLLVSLKKPMEPLQKISICGYN